MVGAEPYEKQISTKLLRTENKHEIMWCPALQSYHDCAEPFFATFQNGQSTPTVLFA
jgi:hypothetical protein